MARHDKNISPVGWYIASYLLRIVEAERQDKQEPEARFTEWENTILVKADSPEEAYDKTVEVASRFTKPYKGGREGVDVQWVFEGVTEVLPVYEELVDGAEIIWEERHGVKLKNFRKRALRRKEIRRA